MSRDSLGCSNRVERKYYRLLVDNGQGSCYTFYSAQEEPSDKQVIQSRLEIVLWLRNPDQAEHFLCSDEN